MSAVVADGVRSAAIRASAVAESLTLMRLFVAALGPHADLTLEDVENLKLALTEVCSAAIEASTSDDDVVKVEVRWQPGPADVDVQVSSSSTFSLEDPTSDSRARLLSAMGLRIRSTDDGRGLAFSVPSTPTA